MSINDFVTIATFNYPTELAIIKGRLESEGIECSVKDELTVQVHNFYSNAIGGVKLQVRRNDTEKAIAILKDTGYITEEDPEIPKLWMSFESLTSGLPFIGNAKLEVRLVFLTLLVILVSSAALFFLIASSTYESLTENAWCLDRVTFEGQAYQPNSMGLISRALAVRADCTERIVLGFCSEKIDFGAYGEIVFPGFNTFSVSGSWTLKDNVLQVIQVDTFQHILEGDYEIHMEGSIMTLTSDKTILHCYRTRY